MKLTVMHEPVGQPRGRSRVLILPAPKGTQSPPHRRLFNIKGQEVSVRATVYDDDEHPVNAFKAAIVEAAKAAGVTPSDKPITLTYTAVFPRPLSMVWKKKPMPRVLHTKKPDIDNVQKAIQDALTGIAWTDDAQVCGMLNPRKWIAAGGEEPHVEIEWYEEEEHGIPF